MLGLRLASNRFNHPTLMANRLGDAIVEYDTYLQYELWYRYMPSARWQWTFSLPFRQNRRHTNKETIQLAGLGDAHAQLSRRIWVSNDTTKIRQSLWFGAGIQIPTGPFMQRMPDLQQWPQAFQTGSGSYALNFLLFNSWVMGNWGWSGQASARFNATNEVDYRRGNFYQLQWSGWWNTKLKRTVQLAPQLGLGAEFWGKDEEYGKTQPLSGGQKLMAFVGTDIRYQRYLLRLQVSTPLYQQVYTSGPTNALRLEFGLGVLL